MSNLTIDQLKDYQDRFEGVPDLIVLNKNRTTRIAKLWDNYKPMRNERYDYSLDPPGTIKPGTFTSKWDEKAYAEELADLDKRVEGEFRNAIERNTEEFHFSDQELQDLKSIHIGTLMTDGPEAEFQRQQEAAKTPKITPEPPEPGTPEHRLAERPKTFIQAKDEMTRNNPRIAPQSPEPSGPMGGQHSDFDKNAQDIGRNQKRPDKGKDMDR